MIEARGLQLGSEPRVILRRTFRSRRQKYREEAIADEHQHVMDADVCCFVSAPCPPPPSVEEIKKVRSTRQPRCINFT